MLICVLLKCLLCLEDYENMVIVELRKIVEESIIKKEYNFFKLSKDNVIYSKIELHDEIIHLTSYSDVYSKKEDLKNHNLPSTKEKDLLAIGEKLVDLISARIDENLESLIVFVEDFRMTKNYEKMLICKIVHDILNKKIPKYIKVTSPLDALGKEFLYISVNTLSEKKFIIKFPIDVFFDHENYDVYFYKEIYLGSECIRKLISEIKILYTTSKIRNYVRHSIKKEIEMGIFFKSIYDIFPPSYNYEGMNYYPFTNFEKQIIKDLTKRDPKIVDKYNNIKERLTCHDIRGLIVLFYHITRNLSLFEKIIGCKINEFSLEKLCSFLTTPSKEERCDEHLDTLDNISFFSSIQNLKLKNIMELRNMLSAFYIICCSYFHSDLSDEIKRMSEDFVKANHFECTIKDKEATEIIYKAVDLITLNPFGTATHFENDIKRFIKKYEHIHKCELEELMRHSRIFSIYSLLLRITDVPMEYEESYDLNFKEIIFK